MAQSSEISLVGLSDPSISSKETVNSDSDSGQTISQYDNGVNNGPTPEYKMYRRRWLGMLVIIGFNISTGFLWMTFGAVSDISEKWLHASSTEVNLFSTLYFVGSIFTSFFSGYVFEKWGIKTALIVGGVLNLAGCWIRYFGSFIESSYDSNQARIGVLLFGQFVAACAQPFFLNVAPKYSAVWFADDTRAVATTIATVSNPVGIAVAMVVVAGICTDEDGDDMPLTLLVIGIISIVVLVPAFFIPAAPPTPPSPSAQIALEAAKDESFWVALKKVSRNGPFWILWAAFSINVAIFNTVTSLINQVVEPYNYSDDDAAIFGACFILTGIFGAAASSVFVDKTKRYKEVLKCAAPLLGVGYLALIFAVREDFFPWIGVNCAFLGFVSFSVLPVALELGVECTYPCPPSTSTSVLWIGGQTLAVIFLQIGNELKGSSPFSNEPKDTMATGLICLAVVTSATSLLALFFHAPYYRMEAEAEKMRDNQNASAESK